MTQERFRKDDRATYRRMDEGEGGVLLHLDSGSYHQVNEIGALIWDALDDTPTRAELVAHVREQVSDAPDSVGDDVDAFLDALRERDLIVVEPQDA